MTKEKKRKYYIEVGDKISAWLTNGFDYEGKVIKQFKRSFVLKTNIKFKEEMLINKDQVIYIIRQNAKEKKK